MWTASHISAIAPASRSSRTWAGGQVFGAGVLLGGRPMASPMARGTVRAFSRRSAPAGVGRRAYGRSVRRRHGAHGPSGRRLPDVPGRSSGVSTPRLPLVWHLYDSPAGPPAADAVIIGCKSVRSPVVGTSMTAHTDPVHATAAWPTGPASAEVALPLLCEATSQGWILGEPGAIHRRHSKQQTARPAHWDSADGTTPDETLLTRLEAIRILGRHRSPSQHMTVTGGLS